MAYNSSQFSNSNGVTFGTATSPTGNIITASVAAVGGAQTGISGIQVSDATYTSGTVTWRNANGISFGSSGANGISASYTVPSVAGLISAVNVSAGTTSNNLSALTFSNANGVSFGMDGSTITASVSPSGGGGVAISAGTNSTSTGTVVFSNSNGVTFGMNTDGVVTATVQTNYLTTAMASNRGTDFVQANAAFAGTNASGTIASNGISVSVNAQSAVPQNVSLYALGNTTQNSSTALSVNALSFNAIGSITIGYSNGSIQVSAPNALTTQSAQAFSADASSTFQTLVFQDSNGVSFSNNAGSLRITHGLQFTSNTSAITSNALHTSSPRINVSAGTTSNNLSAITFSNSNNFSFGLNGSVITGSYTVPTVTNSSFSIQDSATTINPVARIAFSTGNNITLTLSTGASSATVGVSHNLAGTSTGFGGNLISASMTHNSSGLNLSLNHPAWLTTAMLSNAATISNINISAGTTSTNASAFTFNNANGITFGLGTGASAGSITASHNGLTTARASTDAIGLNTAQSNVTWTVNSSGLSLDARGYVGTATGFTGTNVSATMTHNSAGFSLQLSAAAGGGGAAISGGANSQSTGTVNFANSNGITFGLSNNGTMTASHNGITSQTNQTVGLYALGNTTQNSSSTMDARTLSFNGLGAMTAGFSNGSIQLSAPATSSLVGVGAITLSTNGSTISISGGTVAAAPVNFSAGTTSDNIGSIIFSDSNRVSFGLNGSTMTAKHALNFSGGTTSQNISDQIIFSNSNNATFGLNGSTMTVSAPINVSAGTTSGNLTQVSFANSNGVSFGLNAGTVTASVPLNATVTNRLQWPPGNLTAVAAMGNGSFSINRVQMYEDLSATRLDVPFLLSLASSAAANTWGLAVTAFAAIYTKNVSTLSSLSSGQVQWNTTLASNTAGNTGLIAHAIRPMSVGFNMLFTPGEYYVGFGISTNTSSVGTATTALGNTWSVMGGPIYSSAVGQVGDFTAATNTSTGLFGGQGIYSAAISTVPPTVSLSAINQTGSYYARGNMGIIFRNI